MSLRGLRTALVLLACVPCASASAADGPALSVDASAARHAISPYIYGWNFAPQGLAQQIGLPVDRRGGNAADTLNWQTGVENHSNDWYFENLPTCFGDADCKTGWDPARSYTDQIGFDQSIQAKTLLDLPLMGYVAGGAATFAHPVPCSFPKNVFANQFAFAPDDANCGDGLQAADSSQYVTNTAQLGTATAEGADYQGAWIDDLVNRYGTAANGGVAFYELGNEPGLWDSTHHDWHPQPTTAQELWDDELALAQQVKQHDPSASVVGPAEWGWPNYFCSPKDGGCGPAGPNPVPPTSDWHAVQGDKPLIPWLLSQFKAYQDQNGTRLLDYVDVHYYRQDNNGVAGFDATRSLWDPTYNDQSYIDYPIDLIPRMHSWVDQNYPGTKTSLSEYDFAVDDMNSNAHMTQDVLTEADALGIFGREGLDMATLWPETSESHYADAFRMFRSYDGNHSTFGDTSVSSTSANQSQLAVYGAQRSGDGALTILVINKNAGDLTSSLSLAGFSPASTAQVYRWTDAASGIQKVADQSVSPSGFTATFPNDSMTMFVVPAGVPAPQAPAQQQSNGTTGNTPVTQPTQPSPGVVCRVPNVLGLSLTTARTRLRGAHCGVGKVTKKKSGKPKGRVIAQTPKPKRSLAAGSRVALVLSRGR